MSGDRPDDPISRCTDTGTDCSEALQELESYLDGELPEGELADIRDHLAECYPCADRATFEEQLRALVRERCAEKAPSSLVDAIRARLDEAAATPGA